MFEAAFEDPDWTMRECLRSESRDRLIWSAWRQLHSIFLRATWQLGHLIINISHWFLLVLAASALSRTNIRTDIRM
jgi:hypothetical protein